MAAIPTEGVFGKEIALILGRLPSSRLNFTLLPTELSDPLKSISGLGSKSIEKNKLVAFVMEPCINYKVSACAGSPELEGPIDRWEIIIVLKICRMPLFATVERALFGYPLKKDMLR